MSLPNLRLTLWVLNRFANEPHNSLSSPLQLYFSSAPIKYLGNLLINCLLLFSSNLGTSQNFLKKCKDLEEIKEHKIWAAEKWREYQLQNIENIFQSEQKQAEDEYKVTTTTTIIMMMMMIMIIRISTILLLRRSESCLPSLLILTYITIILDKHNVARSHQKFSISLNRTNPYPILSHPIISSSSITPNPFHITTRPTRNY